MKTLFGHTQSNRYNAYSFLNLKSFVVAILYIFVVSCTTNEHEAKELDDKLEVKDSVDGEKIGLNDDGEVIIQSETSASDELRSQIWVNSKLEDEINREHHELKRCREDLADPRLGGNGRVAEIPDVDGLKSFTEIKEKFGLDSEGNLKVLKKEYFLDRLKKERNYAHSLKGTLKIIKKHGEDCARNMASARLKHGLPGKRYESEGYFTSDGAWVGTEKAEKNLDDAFERAAKAKAKSEQNSEN